MWTLSSPLLTISSVKSFLVPNESRFTSSITPVVFASVCKSYLGRPSLLGCDFCDNPGVPLSRRNNWMQKSIPMACRCRMDVSRPISTPPPHWSRPFILLHSCSIETTRILHPLGISSQSCRLRGHHPCMVKCSSARRRGGRVAECGGLLYRFNGQQLYRRFATPPLPHIILRAEQNRPYCYHKLSARGYFGHTRTAT